MEEENEITKELEKSFRDKVAPTWYSWGTRFVDENLNEHCRIILKDLEKK